jgi:hypothetical protein
MNTTTCSCQTQTHDTSPKTGALNPSGFPRQSGTPVQGRTFLITPDSEESTVQHQTHTHHGGCGTHRFVTFDQAREAARKAPHASACLTTFDTITTGTLSIETSRIRSKGLSPNVWGCLPETVDARTIHQRRDIEEQFAIRERQENRERAAQASTQASAQASPNWPAQAATAPFTDELGDQPTRILTSVSAFDNAFIPRGITPRVIELLPAILARPHIVLRNAEFYLIRPNIFESFTSWVGMTHPAPLGAILESWLVTGRLALTADAVAGPRRDPDASPIPYRRIFIYGMKASGLGGSHLVKGVDPDTGTHHEIGHPTYDTRLPGSKIDWHKRFEEISDHLPIWLRDETRAVERLEQALAS